MLELPTIARCIRKGDKLTGWHLELHPQEFHGDITLSPLQDDELVAISNNANTYKTLASLEPGEEAECIIYLRIKIDA